MPRFDAVEVKNAAEREFMSPLALPNTAAYPRDVKPGRCVESVSGLDFCLGCFPTDFHGLHVDISEAQCIHAGQWLVGLEADVRPATDTFM
jgi:hypothetical protein